VTGRAAPAREGNALLTASLALALGGWLALDQDVRGRRPFAARKRRITIHIALAIASRLPAAQRRIGDVSGVPNLGSLVAMLAAPTAVHTNLSLYGELTGAALPSSRNALIAGSLALISLC
jgi:hypothetical protein